MYSVEQCNDRAIKELFLKALRLLNGGQVPVCVITILSEIGERMRCRRTGHQISTQVYVGIRSYNVAFCGKCERNLSDDAVTPARWSLFIKNNRTGVPDDLVDNLSTVQIFQKLVSVFGNMQPDPTTYRYMIDIETQVDAKQRELDARKREQQVDEFSRPGLWSPA
jgi:hypothetical protein